MTNQHSEPITSELSGERIYIPRFDYFYWSVDDITSIGILILGEQIEVKEIEESGCHFFLLCNSTNESVKPYTFEEMIGFLIETDTPFIIGKFLEWRHPKCEFYEKNNVGPDGVYWPYEYLSFGYKDKLPYRAFQSPEGDYFWEVCLPYCNGPLYDYYVSLGWEDAQILPYSYDLNDSILTVSDRIRPEVRELGFAPAIEFDHYEVYRYKNFNKLVVNYCFDGGMIIKPAYGQRRYNELLLSREKREGNSIKDTRDIWLKAEKLPYTYYRIKRVLRVKVRQKSQELKGWGTPERLPYKLTKEGLIVTKNIISGGWEKAVSVEGITIGDLKLWDNRCLERWHLNVTQLSKFKKIQREAARNIKAVGYYNCHDCHSSKILFFDAKEIFDRLMPDT